LDISFVDIETSLLNALRRSGFQVFLVPTSRILERAAFAFRLSDFQLSPSRHAALYGSDARENATSARKIGASPWQGEKSANRFFEFLRPAENC